MKRHQLSSAIALAALTCCIHSKTFSQTDWHITGNAGTSASTNFIGTTDNQGLSFRTNNNTRMRIGQGGNIGIGTTNPLQKLDVNGNINIGPGFFLFMDNHRVLRIDSAAKNTFLGVGTGVKNVSSFNTALGHEALASNTSGSNNIATGYQALYSNGAGYNNTATGVLSLYFNTTGNHNVAYGNYSLFANTTGSYNTANGFQALSSNTTGSGNTAQGYYSLYYNTTGGENIATGKYALYKNSTGFYNTATGTEALYANTDGSWNSGAGYRALYANTTGYSNAASGAQALFTNTTGSSNTAHGVNALYSNVYGSYNTAVGDYALFNTSYSSGNTAVGDIAGASYQNGWNNTFIGAQADATAIDIYNSIAIGSSARVSAPNQVRIGNSFTSSIGGYAGWSTVSDGRVKKNIKDNVPGLAFINKLKAVTYNLDLDAADKFMQSPGVKRKGETVQATSPVDQAARQQKQKVIYTGFIAQDVEKAAKELNYDFSGVDAAKNEKDLYSIRYSEFVVPLVKAVQELSKENDELKKENVSQQKLNGDLQQRLEKLESMMNVKSSDASSSKQQMISVSDATMQQNIPNPFNRATTINYTLPQQSRSAKIVITDKSGKTLKEMNVTANGKNSVVVDASTLSSGTYQYSLYADGKLISTKQMVLTK